MKRSFFLLRSSGWHTLYPLTKLVVVMAVLLVGLAAPSPIVPLALCVIVILPLVAWAQILREWLRASAIVLLPFAISVLLIQTLFFPGATHSFMSVGPFALKEEGLFFAFGTIARLLLLAGAGLLLLLSTHPADMMHALEQHGLPPALAYIAVAALELVPQMQARAESIADAQRARGLELEGSFLTRVRGLVPLLAPLVLSALSDVDERAMALEARAFSARRAKTSFKPLVDTKRQSVIRWCLVCGAIVFAAAEVLIL